MERRETMDSKNLPLRKEGPKIPGAHRERKKRGNQRKKKRKFLKVG